MYIKKIANFNIKILSFFFIGLILTKLGFPFLQYFSGILLFFLPGINTVWSIELLSNQKLNRDKLIVLTIAISPIINALFLYIAISLNKFQISENFITITLLILTTLTAIAAICTKLITKNTETILEIKTIKNINLFLIITSIISIFLSINFILYKFIPEGDGYLYLIQLRDIINQEVMQNDLPRSLFITFSLSIWALTKIPFYWIFKILIPLLVSSIFLPFYLIAKEKYSKKLPIILVSILPFTIPVICMEILYPRPQSIFMLSFTLFTYLLIEILKFKNESAKIYLISTLLFFSIIGTKIHEFFFFLILISVFSLFLAILPILKKKPKESSLLIIITFIAIMGWIRGNGIMLQFNAYFAIISTYLSHPKLQLWFINNYTNVDGSSMGWPGYSWIFYYGYNLGLIMPLLLLCSIFKKFKNLKIDKQALSILTLAFSLFFLVAEIFPRLGLALYPDRAWLFVSISVILFFAYYIPKNITFTPIQKYLILSIFIASISTSLLLTYAKQGWTSPNEYEASQFIKNNTPKDAIIISQGANGPMINYFAERMLIIPPNNFFLSDNNDQISEFIKNIPNITGKEKELSSSKNDIITSSYNLIKSLNSSSNSINEIKSELNNNLTNYYNILKVENEIRRKGLDKTHPIFIIYSNDKFNGLYGNRDWWKEMNFYSNNISANSLPFQNIYNKNNILIWKI